MAQSKFCKDCVHARPAASLLFSTQERWRYAHLGNTCCDCCSCEGFTAGFLAARVMAAQVLRNSEEIGLIHGDLKTAIEAISLIGERDEEPA